MSNLNGRLRGNFYLGVGSQEKLAAKMPSMTRSHYAEARLRVQSHGASVLN